MAADAVFARLRRRPFTPLRLIVSGGTTVDILHPQMAVCDRGQRPSPDAVPMREALVSHLRVATTEDLPATRAG